MYFMPFIHDDLFCTTLYVVFIHQEISQKRIHLITCNISLVSIILKRRKEVFSMKRCFTGNIILIAYQNEYKQIFR